jgi:probable rRNA maturation factor
MSVAITNLQRARKINLRFLKKITNRLLLELEVEAAEISICLVDAPEMTRLNETFLRHAGPTDVITFDYAAPGSPTPDAGPEVHGEIFVCVTEAVSQARKFDASWQSEIVRYIVHGVLHLLSFDDSNAVARRKMKREEARLLGGLTRRFSLAQLSRPARLSA